MSFADVFFPAGFATVQRGGDLGHAVGCPKHVDGQLRKRLLLLRDKVYRHHREFKAPSLVT